EISWLNWHRMRENEEHWNFTKHMIELRRKHTVVRKPCGKSSGGLPELMTMLPDENSAVLRVVYAGRNEADDGDDYICLAVNIYWEPQFLELPVLPQEYRWEITADTSERYLPCSVPKEGAPVLVNGVRLRMDQRSVIVLSGYRREIK
ncbi:MAG: glycogen debranching enzyme, partial [Lachnospiraceae bacterium]|nr:glycogen debranching enzyme [Lachnospiraceae bacterium]